MIEVDPTTTFRTQRDGRDGCGVPGKGNGRAGRLRAHQEGMPPDELALEAFFSGHTRSENVLQQGEPRMGVREGTHSFSHDALWPSSFLGLPGSPPPALPTLQPDACWLEHNEPGSHRSKE